MELIYSEEAAADLESIGSYTEIEWGAEQADAYLLQLDRSCRMLLEFPEMGQPIDHLLEGARRLRVNSHLVYYRHLADRVRVIRVLHMRMNQRDHLDST